MDIALGGLLIDAIKDLSLTDGTRVAMVSTWVCPRVNIPEP